MCRFVMYLGSPVSVGSLVVEPDHSLIRQSVHANEREEPLNGDGFGVAWYAPEAASEPAVFRSITPAWNNRNLLELSRVTSSGCILAHIRAATQALEVSEQNCHPFTSGPYAFMHNGDLGGFRASRRRLLSLMPDPVFAGVRGTTDSEHLFGVVLDDLSGEGDESPEELAEALTRGVRRALEVTSQEAPGEHSYLNIALATGRAAVACRYTTDEADAADSLYVMAGRRYACEGGVCRMIAGESDLQSVIIASERLSDDPGWSPVPVNHLVLAWAGGLAEVRSWPDA